MYSIESPATTVKDHVTVLSNHLYDVKERTECFQREKMQNKPKKWKRLINKTKKSKLEINLMNLAQNVQHNWNNKNNNSFMRLSTRKQGLIVIVQE